MKQFCTALFWFFFLLIFLSYNATAQDIMRITQKDGTTTDFSIAEIRKLTFTGNGTSATKEQMEIVKDALLKLKVYPNPTRNIVNLDYELSTEGKVVIEIYDMSGNLVLKHFEGDLLPGKHVFKWKADRNPSGQYIFRIRQNNIVASEKIIVNR